MSGGKSDDAIGLGIVFTTSESQSYISNITLESFSDFITRCIPYHYSKDTGCPSTQGYFTDGRSIRSGREPHASMLAQERYTSFMALSSPPVANLPSISTF